MNAFDLKIMSYSNQFSQKSWAFDRCISFLSGCNLLKGGVLVAIVWWLWFKSDDRQYHNRENILSTLLCCFIAEMVSRGLSLALPFRLRPLYDERLGFLIPYGMEKSELGGWSSFPSDHAVLFFALSMGLWLASRKAGAFALAYTTVLIAFPRIYLGLHYPTDIIAGATIGMTIAYWGNLYLVRSKGFKSVTNWLLSIPEFFYPAFFILTYQLVDMFSDIRSIISLGYKLLIYRGGYFGEH
jgi:undecaprenyl-diphosphatase